MADFIVPDAHVLPSLAVAAAEAAGPVALQRVRIRAGTYVDTIVHAFINWTTDNCLYVESFSDERDVIIDGGGGGSAIDLSAVNYISYRNMTIRNARILLSQIGFGNYTKNLRLIGLGAGVAGGVGLEFSGSAWNRTADCEISNCERGIECTGIYGPWVFERTYIHDCVSGMYIDTGAELFMFSCRIINCSDYGIRGVNYESAPLFLYNCTISRITGGAAGDGISLDDGGLGWAGNTQFILVNTIISNCDRYGISINWTQNWSPFVVTSDGNCFHDLTAGIANTPAGVIADLAAWRVYTRAQTGRSTEDGFSIANDPLLNADGTLQTGSPCINRGIAGGSTFDLDGDQWTDPLHPPIGADGQWDQVIIGNHPVVGSAIVGLIK